MTIHNERQQIWLSSMQENNLSDSFIQDKWKVSIHTKIFLLWKCGKHWLNYPHYFNINVYICVWITALVFCVELVCLQGFQPKNVQSRWTWNSKLPICVKLSANVSVWLWLNSVIDWRTVQRCFLSFIQFMLGEA